MKAKQKQKARRLKCMWAKKLLKYQAVLLLSVLLIFIWFGVSLAFNDSLIITEIMYNPDGSDTHEEWIEIYNQTDQAIDLSGWKFFESGVNHSLTLAQGSFILSADERAVIAKDATKFMEEYDGFTGILLDSSFSLSNEGEELAIKNKAGEIVAQANYSKDLGGNDNGFSLELDKGGSWRQSYVLLGTPADENSAEDAEDEPEPTPEPEIYSDEIWINELLPNPKDGEDEYIELYNNSDEKIELKNWSLHDASKSGEYIFSEKDAIESEEYLAVYGETFKFALNNGGDEKITLYDPNKKRVFEVAYKSSKKGVSYNFDGEKWHWSSFLTPGTENIFEEIPDGKIKIDKKVFVEVFANFEVVGLSKKAKVTWDFGDGHKSYLQKTKHKYKKTGKYEASVKYSEGSEDVTEKFTIEVEKIKHPEVKIVAVNANPVGSDTKNETITVQNKSGKKINLKGWSIATGWKKLVNHPITEKIEIKAGKKKEITRESSKFTLNNKKAEIELRYPDGKTAYKMKYKKEDKGIAEGEVYVKEKGGWTWVASIQQTTDSKQQKTNNIQPKASGNQIEGNNQEGAEENEEPEVIEEDVEIVVKKKEVPILLAASNKYFSKIKISSGEPQVLGAETVRESDGTYFFTPETTKQEHYAVTFARYIFFTANMKINTLVNYFFEQFVVNLPLSEEYPIIFTVEKNPREVHFIAVI